MTAISKRPQAHPGPGTGQPLDGHRAADLSPSDPNDRAEANDDNGPTPLVLAMLGVSGTATIDHGNTVVVNFETAEGNSAALLMPRAVAVALVDQLSGALLNEPMPAVGK